MKCCCNGGGRWQLFSILAAGILVACSVGSKRPPSQSAEVELGTSPAAIEPAAQRSQPNPHVAGQPHPLSEMNADPSALRQAVALLDLRELPDVKGAEVFELSPVNLSLPVKRPLKDVDQAWRQACQKSGWQESAEQVSATPEYVDRTWHRNGFAMRYTLSPMSADQTMASAFHLGNQDMRKMPSLKGATPTFSQLTNAATKVEVDFEKCCAELTESAKKAGWRICQSFDEPLSANPSYRMVNFHHGANRCSLSVVAIPNEKSLMVSWMSQPMMACDLSLPAELSELRCDPAGGKIEFDFTGDRAALVQLIEQHAESFGWKLTNKDAFIAKTEQTLTLAVGDRDLVDVHLMERGGKTFAEFNHRNKL